MCMFADKLERAADQWGLMYNQAKFSNQNGKGSTDKTSVCSTIWLAPVKEWCILSPCGLICALRWPMVRRKSYYRLALIGSLPLALIEWLRHEVQFRCQSVKRMIVMQNSVAFHEQWKQSRYDDFWECGAQKNWSNMHARIQFYKKYYFDKKNLHANLVGKSQTDKCRGKWFWWLSSTIEYLSSSKFNMVIKLVVLEEEVCTSWWTKAKSWVWFLRTVKN